MSTQKTKKQSELVVLKTPELSAVSESRAAKIRETFEPMVKMLNEFEEAYNELITLCQDGVTDELARRAKRLRLDVAQVRINTEKLRKQEKEESLREGKAIDGVSNLLKWAVTEKENNLLEIEEFKQRQEAEAKRKLQQDRAELLHPYVETAYEMDLAGMTEDVFEIYLAGKKKEHEDRLEAERLAEEERIKQEEQAKLKAKLQQDRSRETYPFAGYFKDWVNIQWYELEEEDYSKQLAEAKQWKEKEEEMQRILKARQAEVAPFYNFFEVPAYQKLGILAEADYQEKLQAAKGAKAEADAKADAERKAQEKARQEAEAKAKAAEEARKKAEAQAEAARKEAARKEEEEQAKLEAGDLKKWQYVAEDLQQLMDKYSFKAKKHISTWEKVKELLEKAQDLTGK